jgi:hypothetical protein
VSKETRKDFVLLAITSIAAAIGMRSVFSASRPLAWIAIGISDAYLALVLLFAAILSDDETVATRRASNNTREFTKEADKAKAKQALANGVTAEVNGQP